MAGLRRSLISIIAAIALLCGLGWTAAAYACPDSVAAQPADDGCAHSQPVNGAIPYCGPVCLGVVPAVPTIGATEAIHAPPYIVTIPTLESYAYAPEPPPPRAA